MQQSKGPDRTAGAEGLGEPGGPLHPVPEPRSALWLVAAGAVLLLLAGGAWLGWRMLHTGEAAALLAETSTAIDSGDLGRASEKLAAAEALDPELPAVGWMKGRLAHAREDHELAAVHLAPVWKRAVEARWGGRDLALVALEYADTLAARGEDDKALAINDRALASLLSLIDDHLDRDDLGPGALPLAGAGQPVQPGVREAIGLLQQRGAVAAARARGLIQQGQREAAERILKAAEDRIAGTVCVGTHRVYCRDARAALRDLATGPIHDTRTQARIARALDLVKAGKLEQALEIAEEARKEASKGEGAQGGDGAVAREAARVEYAVRVAWGAELEKQKAWKDAHEQYSQAAVLHAQTQMAQAPHAAGLDRTAAITGLLKDTDSVLDGLTGVGIGDEARKRFHSELEKDPLNPKIYAEEALSQARAARLARDPAESRQSAERVERYLEVGQKVAPEDRMAGFYQGVTRFLAGYPREGLEAMQKAYEGGYRDRAAELYLAESLGLRGRSAQAAEHWKRAWQARKTDTYVGRRAIEAMIAAGDLAGARQLLIGLLEERALDEHLLEAQVMVSFAARDDDGLRRVLSLDNWRYSAKAPDAVVRAGRIGQAVYNKLRDGAGPTVLEPGEELIDQIYGYAIPADAEGLITGKRVQSALLVLTSRRALVLRWDAARDYADEVKKGVALARRAARLGVKLGGEWAGLNLGDSIEKLAQVLDLLPEAERRAGAAPTDTLGESVDLVIESLEMFETLQRDVELLVDARAVSVHPVEKGQILSYDLVPVRPDDGLYALYARTRDGTSLWHTDSERLFIYTARPSRVRMYMDRYLARQAGAPPQAPQAPSLPPPAARSPPPPADPAAPGLRPAPPRAAPPAAVP